MEEIIKKLRFRDSGVVLNAPANMEAAFVKLGFKTSLDKHTKSKNTIVFIASNDAYMDFLNKGLQQIEHDCVLWFAYPKGSSKVKADINRDTLRVTGESFGITAVTIVSIDDTWSALRFRPVEKVGT